MTGLFAASYTTAQLMKLRKTEAVGIFDDHDRSIGNIDAHFDDRGRNEHIDLSCAERFHDRTLLFSSKPSMKKSHARRRKHLALEDLGMLLGSREPGSLPLPAVSVLKASDSRPNSTSAYSICSSSLSSSSLAKQILSGDTDERADHIGLLAT